MTFRGNIQTQIDLEAIDVDTADVNGLVYQDKTWVYYTPLQKLYELDKSDNTTPTSSTVFAANSPINSSGRWKELPLDVGGGGGFSPAIGFDEQNPDFNNANITPDITGQLYFQVFNGSSNFNNYDGGGGIYRVTKKVIYRATSTVAGNWKPVLGSTIVIVVLTDSTVNPILTATTNQTLLLGQRPDFIGQEAFVVDETGGAFPYQYYYYGSSGTLSNRFAAIGNTWFVV